MAVQPEASVFLLEFVYKVERNPRCMACNQKRVFQ